MSIILIDAVTVTANDITCTESNSYPYLSFKSIVIINKPTINPPYIRLIITMIKAENKHLFLYILESY